MKEAIRKQIQALVNQARENGFVVTVDAQPRPPLRAGGYALVVDVRQAREVYSNTERGDSLQPPTEGMTVEEVVSLEYYASDSVGSTRA